MIAEGIGKIDNQKQSTPCRTDLMSSALPAKERQEAVQELMYMVILSVNGAKWAT